MDEKRALVRHTVATLAYRGAKAVRDAPPSFATFRCAESARTPVAILAHLGDLFDWALSLVRGQQAWHDSTPLGWDAEVARFFMTLDRFDAFLASDAPLGDSPERLVQGPIADALTHIGQIALLRRIAGSPIKGENYHAAEIAAGRVGPAQAAPRREF
jgi:hypothetical protein